MKKRWFAVTITIALSITTLFMLLGLVKENRSRFFIPALAAAPDGGVKALTPTTPTVTAVDPSMNPNNIDTPVVIRGSNFTATISGTVILTTPTAYLGDQALMDVIWVSTTTLSATVPWGLIPEVYSLTVVNHDGVSATLQNAFTVTNGIGVWTTDGPYGGTVPQVLVNPFTPTVVYAVADGVALFASYDSAETWDPILEGKTFNFRIAIDAVNPNEIFAGGGGYVYHTQDGGETWDELIGRGSELHHCYVHRLITHPSVSGSVYDAVSACYGWIPPVDRSGIYFSDDHGTTWITLTVGVTDTNFTALAVQPQDPDTILGGTESGNLFVSQNGGQSWNWVAKLNGKIHRLDFNPDVASEAWASARSMISNPPPELYKSVNLTDWVSVTVNTGLTWGQGNWDLTFLTDTIWAASIGVYTSTDSGANWTPVDGWHDSALSLDVAPDDPTRVYVGTFRNGPYRSSDSGTSWQVANDGLAGLNPNAIAVDPNDPDTVYANAEIGLLKSNNGGYNWRNLDLFTGGYPAPNQLATDPFTPEKVYFGQCGDCNVQGSLYSCVSDDGGENWKYITVTLPTTMATWSGGMFAIAPHPAISGTIFGGATVAPPGSAVWENDARGLIFASDDYGENWTLLAPTTPISKINQIAIDAVNPDLVYVATRGSGLWKSPDGGDTWAATPFTNTTDIPYVITHPSQENKVYFASSTIDGPINYVSTDAGETWMRIDSQIEYRAPILFTPTQPPLLYAACEFGEKLCRSQDSGNTWEIVPGMAHPIALAAGTDRERVVIYVGSPGGVVTTAGLAHTSGVEILESIPGRGSVLGGGVYRMTTRLPNHWVYLPLVVRGYAP
jgi:photosystem II stability/assembly factor-like uncharacterized protein